MNSSSPCPQPNYFNSAEIIRLISFSIAVFTTPTNCYGIYLIWFKTPFKMKNMKLTMLNAQLWASLNDLMLGILIIPYLFFPISAALPLGVLSSIFQINPLIQCMVTIWIMGEVAASVILLFENKHYQTVNGRFRISGKYSRYIFKIFNFLFHGVIAIPVFLMFPDQTISKAELSQLVTCPSPEYKNPGVIIISDNPRKIGYIVLSTTIIYTSQAIVFAVHTFAHLFLASRNTNLSIKTRKLQRKYFVSLCFQIIVPFHVLLIPVNYLIFSIVTNYYNQTINNICVIIISIHGFIATITTVLIYDYYRNFTIDLIIRRNRRRINSRGVVETVVL